MDKNAVWKWLILLFMVCFSLAIVWPPEKKITLGLDLKGGTSFVVEIQKDEILKRVKEDNPELTEEQLAKLVDDEASNNREMALEVIRNRVDGLGIAEPVIYSASYRGQERIIVQLPGVDEKKRQSARQSIQDVAYLEFRLVHRDSGTWGEELLATGKAPKGFKISETGEYFVRDENSVSEAEMGSEYYEELRKFEYRPGCEFMLQKDNDEAGRIIYRPYYVEVRPQLKGEAIDAASVDYNQVTQAPYVTLDLTSKGARRFANVTRNYAPRGPKNLDSDMGRQLGIVLDGTLYSAPVIREEIPGGKATITGQFKVPEAMRLANVLNTGALPVPVKIVQTRSVDPSLGRDSIESGAKAAIMAFVAVLVFMLIYYMIAGFIADLALICDMLLLPLGLVVASGFLGLVTGSGNFTGAALGLPTLTLPGIAGIVLTIGMAVDANVLIFERIREEMKAGKRLVSAVVAGYEKAFSTIFDANITTLITAVILFTQGSGPIRGFAVTLTAGIIVSMAVVLVYTRLFFDFLASKMKAEKVRMLSIVGETKINFIGMRYVAALISIVIIAGTWFLFGMRGVDNNLGVDFTGGTSFLVRFEEKSSSDEVRNVFGAAGLDANIQYQKEMMADSEGQIREYLEVRVGEDDGDAARDILQSGFEQYGFQIIKEDEVRGQIGNELRRKGILAIVWALVGIIIYVSFRFQFSFAVGAIVALAHDVLVTVGIYTLLGRQISLPVIAALLTIVGYSVNDTIVVFDRIREDMKLMKGRKYKDIANLSINQTLSRTLLTSFTTLLSVAVLLVFGGGAINDFALTLFIGIIVGTYSSIFVATPVTLLWHRERAKQA